MNNTQQINRGNTNESNYTTRPDSDSNFRLTQAQYDKLTPEQKVTYLEMRLALASSKLKEMNDRYFECYSSLCSVRKIVCNKLEITTELLEANIQIFKLREQVRNKQRIINNLQKGE